MTSDVRRGANDRAVVDLLLAHGRLDRPGIARLAGVSRPSAGEIVQRLIDAGFVEEAGEDERPRRGPNSVLFGLRRGVARVAGIELQPGCAWAEIADLDGTVLGDARCPARNAAGAEAPERLARRAVRAAARAAGLDPADLALISVAAPGIVGSDGDMRYVEGHPGWSTGLLARLHTALGAPVRLENDVKLAAVAEQRHGAATGSDAFVLLHVGEGISAAVVLDGRVVRGSSGAAGEIGYQGHDAAGAHLWDRAAPLTGAVRDAFIERVGVAVVGLCGAVDPELVVISGPDAHAAADDLPRRLEDLVHATTPFRPRIAWSALDGAVCTPATRGATTRALDEMRDTVYGIAPQYRPSARPL